jgi:hypothetical protein
MAYIFQIALTKPSQVVVGETSIDELSALVQFGAAPGEINGTHADLLMIAGVIARIEFVAGLPAGAWDRTH